MNRKANKKVSTSFALSYAITALVISFGSVITTIIWLFQVLFGNKVFSWASLFVFIVVISFSMTIGVALLKVSRRHKTKE